jgi:hypothetical protein
LQILQVELLAAEVVNSIGLFALGQPVSPTSLAHRALSVACDDSQLGSLADLRVVRHRSILFERMDLSFVSHKSF